MSAFLLGLFAAVCAAAAYYIGYQRGRRANWLMADRIIARLIEELELYEQAERELLSEHQLTDDERELLVRMH